MGFCTRGYYRVMALPLARERRTIEPWDGEVQMVVGAVAEPTLLGVFMLGVFMLGRSMAVGS